MDDGLGVEEELEIALRHSCIVSQDIANSGFLSHVKKCNWDPCQFLTWLGTDIDLDQGTLQIPQTKIDKTLKHIHALLHNPRTTAR